VLDTKFGGTDGSPESSACHKLSAGVGRHNKLGWRPGGNFGGFNCDPNPLADAARVDEFSLSGSLQNSALACDILISIACWQMPWCPSLTDRSAYAQLLV
jgi:hypothetical protein